MIHSRFHLSEDPEINQGFLGTPGKQVASNISGSFDPAGGPA